MIFEAARVQKGNSSSGNDIFEMLGCKLTQLMQIKMQTRLQTNTLYAVIQYRLFVKEQIFLMYSHVGINQVYLITYSV